MRFIHCSDIHLGRRPNSRLGIYSDKRYDDYFKVFTEIINTVLKENVDALLIAGDFFDRKELSPEILARTEVELLRLFNADIPVVAIEGNHDNITPGREHESWLLYLQRKGLLQRPFCTVRHNEITDTIAYEFTPVRVCGVDIFGLGYPGGMIKDTVQAFTNYLEESDLTNVIALVHTAPAGGDFLPGVIAHADLLPLKERVSYLACGHFHGYSVYPKENPFVFIPGSSEYWDLAEKNGTKGMILFDTESSIHQFLPTTPRRKLLISLEEQKDSTLIEQLDMALSSHQITAGEDIIMISIKAKRGSGIDSTEIQRYVEEKFSPLRTEIQVHYLGASSATKRREEGESLESVERRIIENWEGFGSDTDAVHRAMNGMKDHLRTGDRDLFRSTFDELLNYMISQEES